MPQWFQAHYPTPFVLKPLLWTNDMCIKAMFLIQNLKKPGLDINDMASISFTLSVLFAPLSARHFTCLVAPSSPWPSSSSSTPPPWPSLPPQLLWLAWPAWPPSTYSNTTGNASQDLGQLRLPLRLPLHPACLLKSTRPDSGRVSFEIKTQCVKFARKIILSQAKTVSCISILLKKILNKVQAHASNTWSVSREIEAGDISTFSIN